MDGKGLRKTEIEVLTNAEMMESELQTAERVSKRPVGPRQKGKSKKSRYNITLRGSRRQ